MYWGRWGSGTQQKCLHLLLHACIPSQASGQSTAALHPTAPAACVGTPAWTPQRPVGAWMLQQSLRDSGIWFRLKLPLRLL